MSNPVGTTKPLDLYALLALVVLVPLVLLLLPGQAWLRVPLGLAFLLVAPGYALVGALFPRRALGASGEQGLGGLERAALSLGLSIAVVPLLGLVLNYTPWGIRLVPIVMTIALFTAAMTAIAWARRAALPPPARPRFALTLPRLAWRELGTLDRALVIACAVAMLAAAGSVAYVVATPRPGESFTEFYILGPGGKAEKYPTAPAPGEPARLLVGVVNHEGAPVAYTLRPFLVNVTIELNATGAANVTEGARTPLPTTPIRLDDEARWEEEWSFVVPDTAPRKLALELWREGGEAPYRTLHLWIHRAPEGAP